MPRPAKVHWDARAACWRTDAGGKPTYFRGIARTDRAAAESAFAGHLQALQAAVYNPIDPTVEQLAELFLHHAKAHSKPRTLQGHREMMLAWCDFPGADRPDRIGLRRARTIKASDLAAMEAAWRARGLSPHYRARLVRSIKACWRWAARPVEGRIPTRLVPENPLAEVPGVAIPDAPERYATRGELAAFLRFAWRRSEALSPANRRINRNLALMVRLMAHTGCRPGEARVIEWHEFHPARRVVVLPPEKWKVGERTGRARTIFLTPTLARAIAREGNREGRHPSHVFAHRRGEGRGKGSRRGGLGPWDDKTLTKAVRKLRAEAIAEAAARKAADKPMRGLDLIRDAGDNRFVAYRLRHTFASDAIMGGATQVEAGAVLGTSARMIEKVYGKVLEKHAAKVAEAVSQRRRGGRRER